MAVQSRWVSAWVTDTEATKSEDKIFPLKGSLLLTRKPFSEFIMASNLLEMDVQSS